MTMQRSAILDLSNLTLTGAEVVEKLLPISYGLPKKIQAKPLAIDPHDDSVIDTTKWATTGTVVEGSFLGVNGLKITGPAAPAYDAAGVIYKPAILASVGKMVLARVIADRSVEFIFSLQEYDFTVSGGPTYTLKYLVSPQDLRNSMGLRWSQGALYFFEGGVGGNEEYLCELPARNSRTGTIYPMQVAFIFTATGWDVWAHIPGVWAEGKIVKQYTRPGNLHATNGYSFCVNAYSADQDAHFYNMAFQFESAATVNGGRIVTSNVEDSVPVGTIVVEAMEGLNAGKPGYVRVRVPDYSTSLFTLEQLAQIVHAMTGKHVYEVQFELYGDIAIVHPVRCAIEDVTLNATQQPA